MKKKQKTPYLEQYEVSFFEYTLKFHKNGYNCIILHLLCSCDNNHAWNDTISYLYPYYENF